MKRYNVIKGDSTLNLKFTVENYPTLDSNWICKSELLIRVTDGTPIYSKLIDVSADNTAFDVNLTPPETESGEITEGVTYFWQVTVENPTLTPPYKRTTINTLEIKYKG